MRLRIAAGTLALGVLLVPAPAAAETSLPPGLGIRQLDVTESVRDGGRSARYVTDHVEPGASVGRRFEVTNGTDDPIEVQLYPADASVQDGWAVHDGRGDSELAGWMRVEPSSLVVPPGERREGTFRIDVPRDAGGGERYAAIVAEAPAVGEDVRVIPRVGVRVYLSVGGPVAPPSDFEIVDIVPGRGEAGAPIALIGIQNPSRRAIDVVGELELTDGPGGLRAGPFPVAAQATIGPGQRGAVEVVLDPSLPDGPWRAETRLDAGDVSRSAEAVITFPEAGLGEAVPLHPLQDRGVVLPIAVGLLALALLLLLIAWRRRRDEDDRVEDEDVPATDDETRPLVGAG